MKIEINFLPEIKVEDDVYFVWFAILTIIILSGYGMTIGILLDSSVLMFTLVVGGWFVLLFLTNFLSRIKIKIKRK